ncbi:hypothetical protein [Aurantimonas sp. VKM B-3413]|uniref:hypothetical protein n=1 Tax=Aurantimonas sp. VKM B-3413 TaxID=2779401 RepID=UPI001E5813DD|nr:hypothetical protein [Aurantimonas sp. VKM B-3413]MCB8839579.1 hypothetical protein [Aurantimonas sp. VKM B-3413]
MARSVACRSAWREARQHDVRTSSFAAAFWHGRSCQDRTRPPLFGAPYRASRIVRLVLWQYYCPIRGNMAEVRQLGKTRPVSHPGGARSEGRTGRSSAECGAEGLPSGNIPSDAGEPSTIRLVEAVQTEVLTMRMSRLIVASAIIAAFAVPAFAEDTMKSDAMQSDTMKSDAMSSDGMKSDATPMEGGAMMTMMKGGEVLAIMPDSHMGTSMMSDEDMAGMMKMASPMDHCMLFMTGSDGKTMMVDTSSDAAMQSCEKIAK